MKRNISKLFLLISLLSGLLCGCSLFDSTAPTVEALQPSVEYGTTLGVSDVADVADDFPDVEAIFQQVDSGGASISEDGESITFSRPGEYSVTVLATDARGNSTEAACPVSVVDTTSPVILSVSGVDEIGYGETISLLSLGQNYIEVKCEDVSDVSLSFSSIQRVGDEAPDGGYTQTGEATVTLTQLGEYILTIDATDEYGNSSNTQTGVSVVDRIAPVISGLDRIQITEHDALPSFVSNVTATDEIDGDLTQSISVDSSAVQKGVPGTYNVLYSVSDAAGNRTDAKRIVLIEDTTPPTISLSQSSVSLTIGDSKPDYKSLVSAYDGADGDVTTKVTVDDSAVDYSKAGTYNVTYTVQDKSGNSSSKTVKVTVKAQATASTSSGGGTVYITKTGSKYHSSGCRYLSKSKIPISKSDAKARGYTACSVCRPG